MHSFNGSASSNGYTTATYTMTVRDLDATKDIGIYRCMFSDSAHRSGSAQLDVLRIIGKFSSLHSSTDPLIS